MKFTNISSKKWSWVGSFIDSSYVSRWSEINKPRKLSWKYILVFSRSHCSCKKWIHLVLFRLSFSGPLCFYPNSALHEIEYCFILRSIYFEIGHAYYHILDFCLTKPYPVCETLFTDLYDSCFHGYRVPTAQCP